MRHAAISISNSCCFNHYLFLRMKSRLRNLIPAFIAALVVIIIVHNNARLNPKHYLLRIALVHPKFSPWRRLLNYGDEGSFLDLTGFNFDGFRELVRVVATIQEINPGPRSRGRPKLLDIQDEIGLYLYYVNSTMRAKHFDSSIRYAQTKCNDTSHILIQKIHIE